MLIHVYVLTKNDEYILPYFLRHYSVFADKIFFYDDRSKDKTLEIAKANSKVTILPVPWVEGEYSSISLAEFWESEYKKYSRGVADWVMMVDSDEFLYSPKLLEVLERRLKEGEKLLKTLGVAMFSKQLPTTEGQIYEECYLGELSRHFNKYCIFNPSIDIVLAPGRHKAWYKKSDLEELWAPRRNCGIKLLHYKFISESFCIRHNYYGSFPKVWSKKLARKLRSKERGKKIRMLARWNRGVKEIEEGGLLNVLTDKLDYKKT